MRKILENLKLTSRELSIQEISDTLSYFEDKKKETINGKVVGESLINGIALTSVLETIEDDEHVDTVIPVSWMYKKRGRVIQVLKERYDELMRGDIHISDIYSQGPFVYDPEKYMYFIFCDGSRQLADLEGNVVPVPIWYDYINGRINAHDYDLDKVIEYMKTDPRFMPAGFNRDDEFHIMSIPWYDADEENEGAAVQFLYLPTQEEAEENKSLSGTFENMLFIQEKLKEFRK